MGTDKPSLVIDGRTLLQRSIDAVVLAGAERVVVVGREQDRDDRIPGVTAIADSAPGSGPLGGFLDGLRYLSGSQRLSEAHDVGDLGEHDGPSTGSPEGRSVANVVLLVASDHPDLQPVELRFIAARLGDEPPDTMAVIPVVDGRDQTLHAAYRPSLAGPLGESFAAGERSLHRALSGHVTVRVDRAGAGRRSYLDVDDPAQLTAYRSARPAGPADSSG